MVCLKKLNFSFLYISLSIVFLFLTIDIILDFLGGVEFYHVVIEIIIIAILFILLVSLSSTLLFIKKENKTLKLEFLLWKEEHKLLMKNMSEAIKQQFIQWELTVAQQQVGFLILKGLSFKEIATVRKTCERTVRKQAAEIYKKAELTGRHEFSAFFFEDLLC